MIVSSLEALLKTDRHQATRQFKVRVPALAAELGRDVSSDFCEEMYDGRSDWVHGASVQLFSAAGQPGEAQGPPDAFVSMARLQDVARAAVRRCIEDTDFRCIFEHDDTIRARWPI